MKKNFETANDVLAIFPEDLKKSVNNPLALKTIAATFLLTNKDTFSNILNLVPLNDEQKETLLSLRQKQQDNLASMNGTVYFGGGPSIASEGEKLGASISRDKGDGEGGHKSNAKTFPGAIVVSTNENAFVQES